MIRIILFSAYGLIYALALLTPAFGQNPSYQPDTTWQPPASAISRQNPLARRAEAAKGGRKLFLRNCAECHGENGDGNPKKNSADFHLPTAQAQTDGSFFWKISNGNVDRGMPSFSKIPEMQRWQLVLYLRELGR